MNTIYIDRDLNCPQRTSSSPSLWKLANSVEDTRSEAVEVFLRVLLVGSLSCALLLCASSAPFAQTPDATWHSDVSAAARATPSATFTTVHAPRIF